MNIKRIAGDNIRGFRHKLEWSQEQLAMKAGLHYSYIGKVERAEATISITNLVKLAKLFKVAPYMLLVEHAYRFSEEKIRLLSTLAAE